MTWARCPLPIYRYKAQVPKGAGENVNKNFKCIQATAALRLSSVVSNKTISMQEKQGKEDLKVIKEESDNTGKYLLRNNKITLIAIGITLFFLAILIAALIISGGYLD